jgi:hypothetical protein
VLAACFSALLVVVRANLHFMRPSAALLHQFDEGYAVALGRRMVEGSFLPYVDGVSHRGPLYYDSVAVAVRIFGNGTWMPVRVLGLTTLATTIGLGFSAAWRAQRSVAGAVMALVTAGVSCVAMLLDDGLAYNSEHLLSAFAMGSLLCLVLALGPRPAARRLPWAALSGVLLAASGLCKQTGFVLLLPYALWIASSVIAVPQLSAREKKAIPIAFALGLALPLLAFVARYAAAGELSTFYYYYVTYNTRVYLAASLGFKPLVDSADAVRGHFYVFLALAPLVFWLMLGPFLRVSHWRELPKVYAAHGFDTTVAIATLIAPFAANATLRNFDHYYVQALPFAGFLLGIAVERLLGELSGVRALVARSLALVPLILVVELGWRYRVQSFRLDPTMIFRFSSHESPVCKLIEKHSTPADSIFVYGFFPAPYTACNRRPASRYVYTTFVAGYVPHVYDPIENDAARAAPGSHRIMEEELLRERPAVILDVPFSLGLRSLTTDAFLRKLVESEYCEQTDFGQPGVRAWVRRSSPACPTR